VRADLRVQADRDRHERRRLRGRAPGVAGAAGRAEVRQPGVVARRRPDRRRDQQPPAVAGGGGAEVRAWVVAVAEHQHVVVRVRPHAVQPDPPVVLRLVRRQRPRRQPPHVVVRRPTFEPAAQPAHRRVPRAVDRAVDDGAARDVHHPQHALLRAALGELVGQERAVVVRLPVVQRRQALGVDRDRVDQHALGLAAVRAGLGDEQDGVLLVPGAPDEEPPVAAPDRHADDARAEQLGQPAGDASRPGHSAACSREQVVLRRDQSASRVVGVSSQRYGSATGVPCRSSTRSSRSAGGYGGRAGAGVMASQPARLAREALLPASERVSGRIAAQSLLRPGCETETDRERSA
jgi:hypothetical protein